MTCEECSTRNVDVLQSYGPCQTCLRGRLAMLDEYFAGRTRPAPPLYDSPNHAGAFGEGPTAGCACSGCKRAVGMQ